MLGFFFFLEMLPKLLNKLLLNHVVPYLSWRTRKDMEDLIRLFLWVLIALRAKSTVCWPSDRFFFSKLHHFH